MSESSSDTHKGRADVRLLWVCLAAFLTIVVLGWYGHKRIIADYENRSHVADHYIDSSHYRDLLLELEEHCGVAASVTAQHSDRCDDVRRTIKSFSDLSALRAQQTMATATRGLLVSSWFHYLAGLISSAVVGVALYALWRMLQQAANSASYSSRETLDATNAASVAAENSLKVTQEGTALALRPYLVFHSAKLQWNGMIKGSPPSLFLSTTIKNTGKSPALNIKSFKIRKLFIDISAEIQGKSKKFRVRFAEGEVSLCRSLAPQEKFTGNMLVILSDHYKKPIFVRKTKPKRLSKSIDTALPHISKRPEIKGWQVTGKISYRDSYGVKRVADIFIGYGKKRYTIKTGEILRARLGEGQAHWLVCWTNG